MLLRDTLIKSIGYGMLFAVLPTVVFAESDPFFEPNAARTVFEKDASVIVAGFRDKPVETAPQNPTTTTPPASTEQKAADTQPPAQPQSLRDSLASKYGDPAKDAPIKAVENAPGPFKAMMEAHAAGDDGLAYEYAQQYVRYVRGVQNTNQFVTSLAGEAMREEGAAEGINEPRSALVKAITDRKVDDKLATILQRAEQAEGVEAKEIGSDIDRDADKGMSRAALRASIQAAGVPVDPKGMVDVFFFLDPNDVRSQRLALDVEDLAKSKKGDARVNVIGVTAINTIPGAVAQFRKRVGVTFPIKDGSRLAITLGVQGTPVVIFMSPNTKKMVTEIKPRSAEYMQEVVRAMQGEGGQ